jgi:hypothetical protein
VNLAHDGEGDRFGRDRAEVEAHGAMQAVPKCICRGAEFLHQPPTARRRAEKPDLRWRACGSEFPQIRLIGSEVMTHDDGGMAASNIDHATKRAGIPPQHVRVREAAIAHVSRAVIHNRNLPA